MDSERILPRELRVNARLKTHSARLEWHINSMRRLTGDILDPTREFSTGGVARDMWRAADVLSRGVLQLTDTDSHETAYRSFAFCRQAVDLSVNPGQRRTFSIMPYLDSLLKLQKPGTRLWHDVNGYLEDNSEVHKYLLDHTDAICAGRPRESLARVSGGMVFMLVDRTEAEEFLHRHQA